MSIINFNYTILFVELIFKIIFFNRDEDAPLEILDEDAEKPEGWFDDELTIIPDPEAKKPEDWDDEEDGDWVAHVPEPSTLLLMALGVLAVERGRRRRGRRPPV